MLRIFQKNLNIKMKGGEGRMLAFDFGYKFEIELGLKAVPCAFTLKKLFDLSEPVSSSLQKIKINNSRCFIGLKIKCNNLPEIISLRD